MVDFTISNIFWTGTISPQLSATKTTYDMRIGVQYTNTLTSTPDVYAVYTEF
jgi:hypothetical protein